MMTFMQSQLTDLLAFARSAMRSAESMLHGEQPALVPMPVDARRRRIGSVSCDRGYEAFAGITANAAVRMHADPVTKGWRSLDFGKTTTGDNRHSQPSRYAT